LFPRLGYYFVVFRAIERTTTDPTTTLLDDASSIGKTTFQEAMDVVEATNIYLVVFKEGICTFHFEDISAHTEAVRKRLLHLEETFRGSSGKYLIARSELC
jgi:magnesium transporter